ncbi:MAG: helix-turn-helix domain-containing protein [Vitreimonas sp.]
MATKNRHIGSKLDDFLAEDGILDATRAKAIKEVVAWQLAEAMKAKNLTEAKMAELMQTSRSQLDRLLDPEHEGVTLETLQRAAQVVGRTLRIELV